MSFVNAGFLFALAALAIPIVIHLLNRWQIQQVELGTMRFLSEVIVENSSRRKIRRWLLLSTRLGLVGLLAFLFARPYLPTISQGEQDYLRVILIDHSASMVMPGTDGRIIDDAIARATKAAAETPEGAKTLVAIFDTTTREVKDLSNINRSPRSLVGATNFESAIGWARDKIISSKAANSDVVLISDFQQTGLIAMSESGGVSLPTETKIELVDVGRPVVQNLAVTRLVAPATSLPLGQDVDISATLFNYGTFAVEEVEVTITADNGKQTRRTKKSVDVPPQEALEVNFELGQLGKGTWEITATTSIEDDLYLDNERRVAIELSSPIPIVLIDSENSNASSAQSYYLMTALEQSKRANSAMVRAEPTIANVQEDPVLPLNASGLTVVSDAGVLGASQIEQLHQYVNDGGALLIFAGEGMPANSRSLFDSLSLSPGQLDATRQAGTMPFRITQVSNRGEMLSPFRDAQTGDLSVLRFTSIQSAEVRQNTEVMASFDNKQPAITRHRLGKGQVVWFLSGAGDQTSNWTTNRLFVPVLQQIMGDMLSRTGEGPVRYRTIGDLTNDESLEDAFENSGREKADDASDDATAEQIAKFDRPEFQTQDRVTFVVNPDPRESDPSKVNKEQFLETFQLSESSEEGPLKDTTTLQERDEVWPWLAACLIVLLVTEFCLANRTAS